MLAVLTWAPILRRFLSSNSKPSLEIMHLLPLRILILLICLPFAAGATESNVDLVKRLYAKYAWESTDSSPKGSTPFIDAPQAELLKYLEPSLAEALLKDRQCAKQTGEICGLDFSPLWASQDPGAKDLRVKQGRSAKRVEVSFTYPGSGERIVIEYELALIAGEPRIRDILYSEGFSLRKTLGVK